MTYESAWDSFGTPVSDSNEWAWMGFLQLLLEIGRVGTYEKEVISHITDALYIYIYDIFSRICALLLIYGRQ